MSASISEVEDSSRQRVLRRVFAPWDAALRPAAFICELLTLTKKVLVRGSVKSRRALNEEVRGIHDGLGFAIGATVGILQKSRPLCTVTAMGTFRLGATLKPDDIVVMDNLASHHAPGATEAIAQVGATALFLPPYSPDFNPIEPMWSKVKQYLRSAAARSVEPLCKAMGRAIAAVTPGDAIGYFTHCGIATEMRKPL